MKLIVGACMHVFSFRKLDVCAVASSSRGRSVAAIDLAEATAALSSAKTDALLKLAGRLQALVNGLLKA